MGTEKVFRFVAPRQATQNQRQNNTFAYCVRITEEKNSYMLGFALNRLIYTEANSMELSPS
jgi:hypothetical protein